MAVKSRADIATAITDLITDSEASITAADLRSVLEDIRDSYVNITTDTVLEGFYTFSAARVYKSGEITFYSGSFYVANTDVAAGAFNATQWDLIGNQIYKFATAVTSAELLALFTTPKTIVAAVTGKRIQLLSQNIKLTYNSIAYATNTSPYLIIDTATVKLADFTEQLAATVSRTMNGVPFIPLSPIPPTDTQLIENKALLLKATSNPTAGNSEIVVEGTYILI